jgi:hypothetical protein
MNCKEWEQSVWLYLYDELTTEQRADCESHLAACLGCRARLEDTRRLHALLKECPSPEPTPELLVASRMGLEDALDREELGWRGLLRGWLPSFNLVPARAAATVLTLVVFGFGLGWTLRPHAEKIQQAAGGARPASFSGADLSDVRINSINQVSPDPQTGEVRISLDAERRVTFEGSLDDPRIRQLLVYAVKSYDNPGIRRDTLDALRNQSDNPSVRAALLFAMRHDQNAGVRLEAMNATRNMECGRDLHQALLDTLEHDSNVGVRIAAVDILLEHAEKEGPDESVVEELQKLAASDQNPSIRMKCQLALHRMAGVSF